MIRISQLKIKAGQDESELRKVILHKLRISDAELVNFVIRKKSIDARHKDNICYVYTVDADVKHQEQILKRNKDSRIAPAPEEAYALPEPGRRHMNGRPLVIGSGPAGLFAAYFLAIHGFCPVVIERGADVRTRMEDVEKFWNSNILNPDSNIQFGEGGAGTFSDGKLNTGNNDLYGRNNLVLRTFVENGAPEEILYTNKPHLGTDLLVDIIYNMRQKIVENGGEYHFNCCFSEFIFESDKVVGIRTTGGRTFYSENIILAIGHSARDTYEYIIRNTPLEVTSKPFAVGVRVEHAQADIDRAQYGDIPKGLLPPADYKLTCRTDSGRSVYSFCMCPGGYVVNSSSETGAVCVNGMSYSKRDGSNANSAIVAAVHPSTDPMENISFARELEIRTYEKGQGAIVSQLLKDFEQNTCSGDFGSIKPCHKGQTVMGNIREILPEDICRDIIEAMHIFAGKIKGFDDPECVLSAVESRTSSPVRIVRNEDMQSNIRGIYPAGEGAGYAGGIMSAAVDGIKVFEKIYGKYNTDI